MELGSTGNSATIPPAVADRPVRDCIVLIHGTWGTNATWTRAGSPLRAGLSRELGDHEVAEFRWSGRNSQVARRAASLRLARLLRGREMAAYRKIHLIGHSHGGNIATRASLIALPKIGSITTINTPFIHYHPRENPLLSQLCMVVVGPLIYALEALALLFLAPSGEIFRVEGPMSGPLAVLLFVSVFIGANLVAFAPMLCGYLVLEILLCDIRDRMARRVERIYDWFGVSRSPILCIFDKKDEASLAIRLSLTLGSRLQALFVFLGALFTVGFIGTVAVFVLSPVSWEEYTHSATLWVVMAFGFGVYVAANVGALLYPLITPSFGGLSLGMTAFRDVLFGRIQVHPLPRGDQVVGCAIETPRQAMRIARPTRHSHACLAAGTVDAAVRWIVYRVRELDAGTVGQWAGRVDSPTQSGHLTLT